MASTNKNGNNQHQVIIPMTRVRTIMKSSPEITNINTDTLYLVCKATELFIKAFAREAYKTSSNKELEYKHLAGLVSDNEKFQFLNEIVPDKVKAKEALKIIEMENKKKAS